MKTFLYLIITTFIATGAMFAALNQHEELLGYGIGLGIWFWFFWAWNKRKTRTKVRKRDQWFE